MISLLDLLAYYKFPLDPRRVKIVRHKNEKISIDDLRRNGWFEAYQSIQDSEIFKECDHILSFSAEDSSASRFIGLYKVGACTQAAPAHVPANLPKDQEWLQSNSVHYTLTYCPAFKDLEDRLVIDWGKGALAWHQWLTDRTILEIRAQGRTLPPFRDYLRVHLTYDELTSLYGQVAAHKDWITGLSAIGAIYLITDSITGAQYVGSATGSHGLWQRWSEYARNGHGGNKVLEMLCTNASHDYPKAFRYSILDTFSRSLTRGEAIDLESFFKQKLGSRAFGLNAN